MYAVDVNVQRGWIQVNHLILYKIEIISDIVVGVGVLLVSEGSKSTFTQ